jgi:drug/metabolite transporter (DMT)-like permease
MAFVFGWAWLNERIDGLQAIGGLLVIAGIVLAQTSRVKEQEKEMNNVNN